MQLHRVGLGHPNPRDDGPGHLLRQMLATSRAHIAYTRREADPQHARFPAHFPHARVIAVEQKGQRAWAIWQFDLTSAGYQGWPILTFSNVEAFCVAQLHLPPNAIWYAASAPLAVEYETGVTHEMF
jgi:hypothetical protein